ncbi:MAG: PEP-CTERM sorting domain-containing protein [Pirellulales bacterium]
MHRTILAVVFLAALCDPSRAATIQFLTPAGSSLGVAYGVDGLNVVGQDVLQRGFLYNGATKTYTVIQPPGGGVDIAARGISGNTVVGYYVNFGVNHGFVYDGANYTTFDVPGALGTSLLGISGNKYVGTYADASKNLHGFLYDGTSYTTLDFPGAKVTRPYDISGNLVVGSYEDAKNRTHGFVYDGTTWTTLDDPLFPGAGITAVYGIDGVNLVGNWLSDPFAAAFVYDGASFNHPFGVEGLFMGNFHQFFGISGNRIVGTYQDKPFVYVVPEPSSLLLAALAAAGSLLLFRRQRKRASPRQSQ